MDDKDGGSAEGGMNIPASSIVRITDIRRAVQRGVILSLLCNRCRTKRVIALRSAGGRTNKMG